MSEASQQEPFSQVDVAIVGGGLAGLITAFRLRQVAPAVRLVLLEASDRLGGKALTERVEHAAGTFLVEAGPDSLVTSKPHGVQLVADLGLSSQLVPVSSASPAVSVLKRNRLCPLPEGMFLLAPTSARSFARSRLLSPAGKARVAMELFLPPRRDDQDESLAAFVTRRFGRETLEWLAEPLMAGIFNADPERMSVLSTFPMFRQLEREHGSVIRALRRQRRPAGASRPPAFVTLQQGMGQIASELTRHLAGLAVTRAPVTTISRADHGYAAHLTDGRRIAARVIVLATPAAATACLLTDVAPDAANRLRALQTRDTGNITLAYPAGAIRLAPPGYGVVIPRAEQRPINAVTVSSAKFPGRAPEGWSLLRVFFGGARSPETMGWDDQRLLDVVQRELRDLFGINAEPAFCRVYRWRSGSPLYDVGHMDRVAEIEHALPPGMLVTGSAYRGVGIPDIAQQAERTAHAAAEAVMSPGGQG